MAQTVDTNKVIEKLTLRIAHEVLQGAINEVAMEDANAIIAAQEASSTNPDDAG